MLARQERGRNDDGHLLAVHGGDERGAQRHFGLAEADIAADEPIHRAARAHVVEHGLDGVELVLGLVIGEARGELVVETLRRRRGAARP